MWQMQPYGMMLRRYSLPNLVWTKEGARVIGFDALLADAILEERDLAPLAEHKSLAEPELIIALISTAGSRLELAAVLARDKDPCREAILRCMIQVLAGLI